MESNRINEAFKKWLIENFGEDWALQLNQVEIDDRKETFTAGYKEGRVDTLKEVHFMIDEPQNYPNRNAEKDLDILIKWIDTELNKGE